MRLDITLGFLAICSYAAAVAIPTSVAGDLSVRSEVVPNLAVRYDGDREDNKKTKRYDVDREDNKVKRYDGDREDNKKAKRYDGDREDNKKVKRYDGDREDN